MQSGDDLKQEIMGTITSRSKKWGLPEVITATDKDGGSNTSCSSSLLIHSWGFSIHSTPHMVVDQKALTKEDEAYIVYTRKDNSYNLCAGPFFESAFYIVWF